MDPALILERVQAVKNGEPLHTGVAPLPSPDLDTLPDTPPTPRYYKPLTEAADAFVRWTQHPERQVFTGFKPIDDRMRGVAPGELAMIVGYSHSGKTLALMELLRNNRDRLVNYFCPDEPRVLTLVKLTCLVHDLNALDLERLIREDDYGAIELLRSTAAEHFSNLAVFDDPISIVDMERASEEIADIRGNKEDVVVLDYLELMQGGGEDVASKANTVKAWGRRRDVPLIVLHQTSRTSGADGRPITISSGAFGGEQQATHIIGVRRKLADINSRLRDVDEKLASGGKQTQAERLMEERAMLLRDAEVHRHTVTLNLVKNKRVGGELLEEGVDFEIGQGTGRLTPLRNGDLPLQYRMRHMEDF